MKSQSTWKVPCALVLAGCILLLSYCCGSYFLWSRSMNAIINGPRDVAGIDVKSNLIVYFRRDTSPEQIQDFHHTVIGTPGRTSTETAFLPGVAGTLAVYSPDGYEGIAIDFFPTATLEQRADLKARVKVSSIVLRIFEDIAPNKVERVGQP